MQFVSAAFLDHADHSARRVAIFSGRHGGENVDFGHRVLQRLDGAGAALLVVAVDAVFKDADGTIALTCQVIGTEIPAVSEAAARHAGYQIQRCVHVALIQREFIEDASGHHGTG
ncbi:MAG: hypothetical protein JWN34_5352 [Bryobacterales bacterium]|nr:hypothetical protein [Bryobacterales bacterium]